MYKTGTNVYVFRICIYFSPFHKTASNEYLKNMLLVLPYHLCPESCKWDSQSSGLYFSQNMGFLYQIITSSVN